MAVKKFMLNNDGMYRVKGLLSPEDIVSEAREILFRDMVSSPSLVKPEDAIEYLKIKLAGEKNEVFSVIFLNNKHRAIGYEEMFKGTIDGAAVYPRVIAQRCLEVNAAAVIFAHNHPSGCVNPSEADRSITRRLVEALGLLDVRVLDHFVIGAGNYSSLAERGWL